MLKERQLPPFWHGGLQMARDENFGLIGFGGFKFYLRSQGL